MKERVVAYSRVSSDHEDQLNSLENQKQHWEEYIKSNPGWEYIGMYWDEGITGTSTKKRDGFNNMIEDAKAGKYDLIITKSVQRWARNTVDSIQFCRELKKIGVAVYFSSDNIHTINDTDAELRLSIMSTLAQEDSRRISENVKFGHLRAMKNGVVYGANRLWGYDIKNKQIFINNKEAEIIKKIFHWFVYENESLHGVVKRLKNEGIIKGKTGGKIDHSTIKRIIENEKYCGDLKQRKYYTENFLEQIQKQNKGEVDFIIIRNNHEPIINRETWDQAQNILKERQIKSNRGIGYTKHCWGGKLICGICQDKFRRKVLKNKDSSERPIWICSTSHDKGKKECENTGYIREDILEDALKIAVKKLKEKHNKERVFNVLNKILEEITEEDNFKKEILEIEKQINKVKNKREKLLELYMDSNLSKNIFNEKNLSLNEEENNLKERLIKINSQKENILKQMKKYYDFYELLSKEYDDIIEIEHLVNEYFKTIIKHKDKLVFILNMGEEIEVPLSKYPKRVNSRDYIPIMDTKIMYLIERGAVRYYDSLNIELRMVI